MNNKDEMKRLLEAVATTKDAEGTPLQAGDMVARAGPGRYATSTVAHKIDKIEGKKVWLNGSTRAMTNPQRLLKIAAKPVKSRKKGPRDALGTLIQVGNVVAKPGNEFAMGDGSTVTPHEVTKIDGGRVYLSPHNRPIKFPDRLIIIR